MREVRQKEAIESWLKSKRNSIIHASPRMGKTKIGLEIIRKAPVNKVLIAYPNLPIKDSWEAEIQKWGLGVAPTFSTFLSLNKALEEEWELIVLDEIHALSEAQIDCIKEYKLRFSDTKILGLSGTLSGTTKYNLSTQLNIDICYEYPIELAVKEGVISDYLIEIHRVPLDNQVIVEWTKKKTKRTEKQQFDHLSRTIEWMESQNKQTFYKRLERMRLIQNSRSKLLKTKELIRGRNLVFCGTTNLADKLGCYSYHSKNVDPKVFEDFCNGKINQLAVCKMLNMGVTINNLDSVILNYTDSNEENLIQKICRCLNYDYLGKTATISIVSSNEEIELKWIKKALKSLDPQKIIWI